MGVASDGDPRLLKAMKNQTRIGITSISHRDSNPAANELSNWEWFNGYTEKKSLNDTIYIQDITHVITKLRNRLLKSSSIYPIGMYSSAQYIFMV